MARSRGIDIRSTGSGNIGATNVARTLGRKAGALVLLLDAAKGALPLLVASPITASGTGEGSLVIASAAILGHCFSPWLGFRGGKGVATTLGVFLVLDPSAMLVGIGAFGVGLVATRIVAVGSLAGAAALPVATVLLGRPWTESAFAVAVVLLLIVLHRENLRRLRAGRESRIG